MTPNEIRAAIQAAPDLLALAPDTVALAAHPTFAGHTTVRDTYLTDRGMVSALFDATGGLDMSDAILTKFGQLAAASPSMAALVRRLETDANGINFGAPGFRAQIAFLTPSVFTAAERDALLALSIHPAPVGEYDIRAAIFHDDGSLAVGSL